MRCHAVPPSAAGSPTALHVPKATGLGRPTGIKEAARSAKGTPSLHAELLSMFHLFSHCWSWLQTIQEPVRKVTLLVVGLDNAGKTSIIMDIERALAGEVLPAVQPGQTCLRVDRFEVTLVDLPGGQRSRSAWRNHYSAAHGFLFVLDSSDLARIDEARKVLSRVLSHPDVSGKPLLLLANKQDSATALLPCELIERLSLERLVNENRSPCRIEPCAANRAPPAGPGRATLQGLRWLLRTVPATPVPPPGPDPRASRGCPPACRDPPPTGEDARDGTGKTGEYRPLRPIRRLLPVEESTKAPGRRKRKGKCRARKRKRRRKSRIKSSHRNLLWSRSMRRSQAPLTCTAGRCWL
ncbi:ADP-ribosylation factor-like protein 13A isoform X4 [Accipiter gentilis]|uniref:ADP-ribosylation factor-like protein 13A isoform X4 n=1 Tax=Astur gentilis TaxID=8957 RepID=UPI00210FAD35|nr:ADP-ribosylation factor-like protein 13A isoform X4 [Accipiter gentilis]